MTLQELIDRLEDLKRLYEDPDMRVGQVDATATEGSREMHPLDWEVFPTKNSHNTLMCSFGAMTLDTDSSNFNTRG